MITLNSQDRFHLYWVDTTSKSESEIISRLDSWSIPVYDLGHELALFLDNLKSLKYINLDVEEFLNSIIPQKALNSEILNFQCIALSNISILIEPFLKIDASRIIKELSKHIAIILLWPYVFDQAGLFLFNSHASEFKFNFSDTNIQQLYILS